MKNLDDSVLVALAIIGFAVVLIAYKIVEQLNPTCADICGDGSVLECEPPRVVCEGANR